MRVVITGAAGHIGGLAAAALSPHDLVLLDRRRGADRRVIVANLACAPAAGMRLRWRRGWDRHLRGADVVVHLAGDPSPRAPWSRVQRHNVGATWHVLAAAAEHRVPKVVFASSNWAVLAEEEARRGVGDRRPLGSGDAPRPLTAYGLSKAFGELAGRMFVDEGRLGSFIAVRIGACTRDGRLPDDARMARRWVGPGDLGRLLARCVAVDAPGFHVVYALSIVPDCPVDLGPTRRLLDWAPADTPPSPRAARAG